MKDLKSKKTGKNLLIVTHNLNLEGAPLFLFNLARGLKKMGHNIDVLSPTDGPVKDYFQNNGIETKVSDFRSDKFDISVFKSKYDIIIVNTITNYKFIRRLDLEEEKVIWALHESERAIYFKHFHDLEERLFGKVKKVVFSSKTTESIYGDLNTSKNFTVINTVGDWTKIKDYIRKSSKDRIKKKYGFRKNDFLINLIGTICLRKGQLEFTEAAISILKGLKNPNLKFLMVGGGRGCELEKVLRKKIKLNGLEDRIIIFDETKEIFDFYFISDIFVCNSYIEAFPMVTLEAMAFGLPIISTDAYGLAEQIEDRKSGLLIMTGDKEELKNKIVYLIKNPEMARILGINARKRVMKNFSFERMVSRYNSLISEVCDKNE